MARTKKIFSAEEIEKLQQSPYVKAVTPYIVSFTAEFKTKFWEIYKEGRSPLLIFRDMGIDPDLLGEKRARVFAYRIKHDAESGREFTDISGARRLKGKPITSQSADEVARMRHELAYLRQEMEFLKKIMSTEGKKK